MTAQADEHHGELREHLGKQQWGKQLTSSIFTREETFPLCNRWLITAFLSSSSTGQKNPARCNDVSNDCILTQKGLQSLAGCFNFPSEAVPSWLSAPSTGPSLHFMPLSCRQDLLH